MKLSLSHAADMSTSEANIESIKINPARDNEDDKTEVQISSASVSSSVKADHKKGNNT